MSIIQDELFKLQDKKYRDFQIKLTLRINRFLGKNINIDNIENSEI